MSMTDRQRTNFVDGLRVTPLHLDHLQSTLAGAVADLRTVIGLGQIGWGLRILETEDGPVELTAGMGFTLLTPTLLLDGLAEGMEIDVHPLPFAGFHREIALVTRERELGDLPDAFAAASAHTLAATIAARLPDLPPDSFQLHTSEAAD